MNNTLNLNKLVISLGLVAAIAGSGFARTAPTLKVQEMDHAMMMTAKSGNFKGVEVNGGNVMASVKDGKIVLTLGGGFKTPKTPAPHWQVVDSEGNVYLLKQLTIAGKKMNKSITVPSYVKDVAKVQIWCSFAEVNLGEAAFKSPFKA